MKSAGAIRGEPGGGNGRKMTTIEAPGLLTFTISIVVFFVGAGLNHVIPPLRRWNIPEAVTGGLLAALVTLIAYDGLGLRSASRSTRATCCFSISSPASASTPSSTISSRAAGRCSCCSG